MGKLKRWIAGAVILGFLGSGAFAMCEYADVYYSRYEYYRDRGDDAMMVAYYTAFTYAEEECQGHYNPLI